MQTKFKYKNKARIENLAQDKWSSTLTSRLTEQGILGQNQAVIMPSEEPDDINTAKTTTTTTTTTSTTTSKR